MGKRVEEMPPIKIDRRPLQIGNNGISKISVRAIMEARCPWPFEKGFYALAIKYYDEALEYGVEEINILSNRALAYLNLGCNERAIQDCDTILEKYPQQFNAFLWKVKALWAEERFGDAMRFINNIPPSNIPWMPNLLTKTQELIAQMLGYFDMCEIMRLKEGRTEEDTRRTLQHDQVLTSCNDIAQFLGPVEIGEVGGKGRGLIATRDIYPGELILVSKAYAIIFGSEEKLNKQFSRRDARDFMLMSTIARKLLWDPKSRQSFCDLHSGPSGASVKETNWLVNQCEKFAQHFPPLEGQLINNTDKEIRKEIYRIIKINHFENISNIDDSACSKGVWILPSYINHACVDGNAFKLILRDTMFIRASRLIKCGEEITFNYTTISDRKTLFRALGFTCDCDLCLVEREESPQTSREISEILQSLEADFDKSHEKGGFILEVQICKLQALIELRDKWPELCVFLMDRRVLHFFIKLFIEGEYQWAEKVGILVWKMAKKVGAIDIALSINALILQGKENFTCADLWKKQLEEDLALAFGGEVLNFNRFKKQELLNSLLMKMGLFTKNVFTFKVLFMERDILDADSHCEIHTDDESISEVNSQL